MIRTLKIISLFIIILGVFAVAINTIFGVGSITYLSLEKVNGIQFYKIDFSKYISNISITVGAPQDLLLNIPELNWGLDVVNNLKIIANLLILPWNIVLYPFKIGGYFARTILGVAGLNFINPSNNLKWLIDLINNFINLQIPFIQ